MTDNDEQPPQTGPPYRPTSQALGQVPSKIPDIPINAVFLILFLIGGACHMFILKKNGRNGKKFGLNGAVFGTGDRSTVEDAMVRLANTTQASVSHEYSQHRYGWHGHVTNTTSKLEWQP